ncbi:MAG: FAD/FMN-containing dehydrogenase [Candidatus Azotimanducaceae bacterium]
MVDATQSNLQELAISLGRMNSIEEIDVQSRTMTVQTGVPLQKGQEQADQAGVSFPLD